MYYRPRTSTKPDHLLALMRSQATWTTNDQFVYLVRGNGSNCLDFAVSNAITLSRNQITSVRLISEQIHLVGGC